MAYDERLAARIRARLATEPDLAEKRMFGGLAFLHRGRMFAGVTGDALMLRVGAPGHAAALARPHVREMDFTGRPLTGYVYVDPPGIATDAQLSAWIGRGLAFVATLPEKGERPGTGARPAPAPRTRRPARPPGRPR